MLKTKHVIFASDTLFSPYFFEMTLMLRTITTPGSLPVNTVKNNHTVPRLVTQYCSLLLSCLSTRMQGWKLVESTVYQ